MKRINQAILWVLTPVLIALAACNDPTVIGSDLLSGDQLDISFTDTVTVRALTLPGDSLVTFDPSSSASELGNFPFGNFSDPIFGKVSASIFAQINMNTSRPNFSGSTIDSVVLILPYNPDYAYGRVIDPFDMEVWELAESMYDSVTYYSTDSFSVKSMPIATLTFTPNLEDSVTVIVPADTLKTEILPPHLRIKLENGFPHDFLLDTANFADRETFLNFFKGIWLNPGSMSQNAGLLNFDMRNSMTGIRVYYHENADTTYRQYLFPIFSGNPVSAHYTHDHSAALLAPFISSPDLGDSLLFLQGLGGLKLEVEIPFVESLEGIIVNKAELVLPIVELLEDNPVFEPVQQIFATEMTSDTTRRAINDITFSVNRLGEDFGELFGGVVTSDGEYRLNISSQLQDMIRGEAGSKILLTVYLNPEIASRVVLGGPGNSQAKAKLRLSFTRF